MYKRSSLKERISNMNFSDIIVINNNKSPRTRLRNGSFDIV